MLEFEALCLSTQSVISLSVKTLLNHVGSRLFLLNSARLLSVKSFGFLIFLEVSVLLVSSVRELVLEWVLVGWREVCEVAL